MASEKKQVQGLYVPVLHVCRQGLSWSIQVQRVSVQELIFRALKLSVLLLCLTRLFVSTYSGSMEPVIKRGDVLFASNSWLYPIKVGDVIMFRTKARKNPIVHRVVKIRQKSNGENVYLTKGDNNNFDDSHGIYEPGQRWLEKEDVLARVFWSVLILNTKIKQSPRKCNFFCHLAFPVQIKTNNVKTLHFLIRYPSIVF
uniref:Signal peptidase complex catalytic subunit SEC11 n=1 Tax=Neogobius melanostomus TaxID=47308 RepID=A0A8C6WL45_9GOBI